VKIREKSEDETDEEIADENAKEKKTELTKTQTRVII
jgi:hypothetical protein